MSVISLTNKLPVKAKPARSPLKKRYFVLIAIVGLSFALIDFKWLPNDTKTSTRLANDGIGEIVRLNEIGDAQNSQPKHPINAIGGSLLKSHSSSPETDQAIVNIANESPLFEGKQLLKSGSIEAAEKFYVQLLKDDLNNIPAMDALIEIYQNTDRANEIKAWLVRGLKQNPDSFEFKKRLIKFYFENQQIKAAYRQIKTMVVSKIKDARFLAFLAMNYQRHNQFKKSVQLYRAALAINPAEAQWWMGLGLAHESRGHWKSARLAYNKAINSGNLLDTLRTFAEQRIKVMAK